MVVELPGESNPLTIENVLNSLVLAAGSTQQQVQTGTKQLQHWEKQERYYTYLQVFRMLLICLATVLLIDLLIRLGCLSRSLRPPGSSIPCHHPTEERNRQILEEDRDTVRECEHTWKKPSEADSFKVPSRKKRRSKSRPEPCKQVWSNPRNFLPFIMR